MHIKGIKFIHLQQKQLWKWPFSITHVGPFGSEEKTEGWKKVKILHSQKEPNLQEKDCDEHNINMMWKWCMWRMSE